MAQFGGYEFVSFSVPLVFEGRYFVMEAGNPPAFTVVQDVDGEPVFDILKNQPCANDSTNTAVDATGVITATDKATGRFLYSVRPDHETHLSFAKPDGGACPAVINDSEILIGGLIVENSRFHDPLAAVYVDPEIGAGMLGFPLPQSVALWLS